MSAAPFDGTARLVHMANQIAAFFRSYPDGEAVSGIAGHIAAFWDPRMKAAIAAHVAAGGAGLDPLAVRALQTLAGRTAA